MATLRSFAPLMDIEAIDAPDQSFSTIRGDKEALNDKHASDAVNRTRVETNVSTPVRRRLIVGAVPIPAPLPQSSIAFPSRPRAAIKHLQLMSLSRPPSPRSATALRLPSPQGPRHLSNPLHDSTARNPTLVLRDANA